MNLNDVELKSNIDFLPEAEKEFDNLDNSTRLIVRKALKKVSTNPLPNTEGGYGVPLRNNNGSSLAGCCKIKLKKTNLRIVYTTKRIGSRMLIIVIGARADNEAYKDAEFRLRKYHLI